MTTIYLTLIIVGLLYGIPASVRTFRREMAKDENVWIVVACGYVMLFYWISQADLGALWRLVRPTDTSGNGDIRAANLAAFWKEVPEVGWGDYKIIATRDPAIFIIRYDWRNNSVLFVHNLDEKPREISFSAGLPGEAGKLLVNLLTEDHSRADERGRRKLLMEAYGYRWYRVGGLDYLLKRSDISANATAKQSSG
jgi:maltose alpha-D-glucosyltransferase/alpha-amylase